MTQKSLDCEFARTAELDPRNTKDARKENWEAMFQLEKSLLGLTPDQRPTALCLSGGGVRSAITCLGVVDVLAQAKVLERVDYLSTVSGGGYTGVALSTWLNDFWKARVGPEEGQWDPAKYPADGEPDAAPDEVAVKRESPVVKDKNDDTVRPHLPGFAVPFVDMQTKPEKGDALWLDVHADDALKKEDNFREKTRANIWAENQAYIRHLRANVGYLTPKGVASVFVGVYAVLRAMLLNLFIWVILLSAIFYVLINGRGTFQETSFAAQTVESWSEKVSALAAEFWLLLEVQLSISGAFIVAVYVSLLFLAFVAVATIVYSLATYFWAGWRLSGTPLPIWENALRKRPKARFAYSVRRFVDTAIGRILLFALLLGAFALIPMIASDLDGLAAFLDEGPKAAPDTGTLVGAITTLVGIGAAIFTFVRNRLGLVIGNKTAILAVVGSVLFVAGVVILAYMLANDGLTWRIVGFAAILAVFVSINDISLGRYYRDRVIEAFVPDRQAINKGGPLARNLLRARKGDKLRLHEMRGKTECQRPLHIVNTNLTCPWSQDTRARRRNGDNFILSAVGTGSDVTGWRPTANVATGRLTLATAMSASGAAVNPSVGFGGQGATTQGPVAIAMSILSVRLGYWLRWRGGFFTRFNRFGNHLNPPIWHLLKAFLPGRPKGGHGRVPRFVELTDGANFENLGLYEMIRRRARVIIVCDAGDDRESSYSAFTTLIRRVREDFGAKIEMNMERDLAPREANVTTMVDTGPQDLVARKVENQYPKDVEFAKKGYFLASITYGKNPLEPGTDGYRASAPDDTPESGLIIYLKSALIPSVSITTKGYRGANSSFPYDSTANQFFSAEQFEAYRDMGQTIARQMVRDLHLDGSNKTKTVFAPETSDKSDSILMQNPAFRRKDALD